MPKQTIALKGTPHEVGAEVFNRFCMPALQAAQRRPPEELVQCYAGMLGAAMGCLAADFGHEMAVAIVRRTLTQFEGLADAFDASRTN